VLEHAFGHFYAPEEAMEKVLKAQGQLDGIFCVGDMLAIRCLRLLEKMGLSVPGDVGVIGFGNLGLPGDYGARLTTFEQNPYEVGQQAAKLLYSRIGQKRKSPAQQQLIAPTLVDMGTC
jgi:LacI family transcriptional regulator